MCLAITHPDMVAVVLGFALLSRIGEAFPLIKHRPTRNLPETFLARTPAPSSSSFPLATLLSSKQKDDEADEEDNREGMAKAFRDLENLKPQDLLGDDDSSNDPPSSSSFAENLRNLETESFIKERDDTLSVPPEEEMKLYKEMMSELELEGGQDATYSGILNDMGSNSFTRTNAGKGFAKEDAFLEDADGIGSTSKPSPETSIEDPDMDKFMAEAFAQAMDEVKNKSPEDVAATTESVFDDKDMMREIEEVFDKANEKLLAGLDEIRRDQAKLTKESARARIEVMKEDEERLAEAEQAVSRMIDKVNKETAAVEKAMQDLEDAQSKMTEGDKLSELKGGFVKQVSLVGAVLFASRAATDAFLMVGGGPDVAGHGTAAVVQGAIALAFAAYFIFA